MNNHDQQADFDPLEQSITALKAFVPIHAPAGFAQMVMSNIVLSRSFEINRIRAPINLAQNLASAIAIEAELQHAPQNLLEFSLLQNPLLLLEPIKAPTGLARKIAITINQETLILPEISMPKAPNRPTRPFLSGLVLSAILICFAVGLTQIAPFGSARISKNEISTSILRIGGDLNIAGHVTGDAISIGGNVRLEAGAQVDGKIMTFLGDVQLPTHSVADQVTAIVGLVQIEDQSQLEQIRPNVFHFNTLKPAYFSQSLRVLLGFHYWQWLYFGITCGIFAIIATLPGWVEAFEKPYRHESVRSIRTGFITILTVLLASLIMTMTAFSNSVGLSVLILIATIFTVGLSISAVQLGCAVRNIMDLPRNMMLEACLGLGVLGLTFIWMPLGTSVCLVAGAWGTGALLITWQSGHLAVIPEVLISDFTI